MAKTIVATTKAPGAIGPYSQGIKANGFVFASGQMGLVPETGQFAEGGVTGQTRQSLTNVKHVLEAAGSGLEKVVKVTVLRKREGGFHETEIYCIVTCDDDSVCVFLQRRVGGGA